MKRYLVIAGLMLLVTAVGVNAQDSGNRQNGPFTHMYQHLLQQDADGDGIPNGQDPDWEGLKSCTRESQYRYSWVQRLVIMLRTRTNATIGEFKEFVLGFGRGDTTTAE